MYSVKSLFLRNLLLKDRKKSIFWRSFTLTTLSEHRTNIEEFIVIEQMVNSIMQS